jgi:hypothetical protein
MSSPKFIVGFAASFSNEGCGGGLPELKKGEKPEPVRLIRTPFDRASADMNRIMKSLSEKERDKILIELLEKFPLKQPTQ